MSGEQEVIRNQSWLIDELSNESRTRSIDVLAGRAVQTALQTEDFRGNGVNVGFAAQAVARRSGLFSQARARQVFEATLLLHDETRAASRPQPCEATTMALQSKAALLART